MPRFNFEVPKLTKRKLFDIASSSTIVHVGWMEGRWHEYAFGYQHAAELLVDRLINGRHVSPAAGLAVLYLYRHSVELSLKGMLQDAGDVLDQNELPSGRHPLKPLWAKLRTRMNEISSGNSEDWLDRAGELIAELDSVDEGSFTFRYPVDKSGSTKLPSSHTVDIENFKSVMDELYLILDGCGAWLENYVDIARDMREAYY